VRKVVFQPVLPGDGDAAEATYEVVTSSGTWDFRSAGSLSTVDVLVVAGGDGGGAGFGGGGGGAGGVVVDAGGGSVGALAERAAPAKATRRSGGTARSAAAVEARTAPMPTSTGAGTEPTDSWS